MTNLHEEASELLGAYALHAVDLDERRLVERHLESCRDCQTDLANFENVAGALGGFDVEVMSSSWEQIAERLEPAQTVTKRVAPWMGIAAAVSVVALTAGLVFQQSRIRDLTAQVERAESELVAVESLNEQDVLSRAATTAMAGPGARLVSLGAESASSQVTIVLSNDGTGYVADHNLPKLPPNRTYQLWAVVGDEVISAGVLGNDPGVVPFRVDLEGLAGLAVTEEVVGGVVTSENPAVVVWLVDA